ncbi:SDR family oxidoreductase, partial [Okeania hirsuta]|uniref:SDR family oxidoreductase n=1 Tax=Okeania hirsuta TaxID=1458930 RepID=UPI001F01FD95
MLDDASYDVARRNYPERSSSSIRFKLILITGVSRGLGRAMTEAFIQLGHTVIGCSLNKEAIASLEQKFGEPHHFTAVDIADEMQVKNWSQVISSKYDPPDLIINNAGIVHELAPFWEIEGQIFDRVIDINIKGVANVLRNFLPQMVAKSQGVIVNFSAGWGRYTTANAAPYCASKWAIEGLTKALSQELPPGMAAVSLWPGTIHTDTLETVYGDEKAAKYIQP